MTSPSTPEPPPKQESEEVELRSDKGADYTRLRDLLAAGKWQEADIETVEVMLQVAGGRGHGFFFSEDIDRFPCTDLRTIDRLWVKYSNGHFGFSVQKEIYQSLGDDAWGFSVAVGWTRDCIDDLDVLYECKMTFDLTSDRGPLPYAIWRHGFCAMTHNDLYAPLSRSLLFSRVETCEV